jgi:predicted lipoprotein with Yx(FWY)xxD motif
VRFAATVLLWLITTLALALAIPAGWTQLHVVDADGYAALAQRAATDPALQSAMADELTARATTLVTEHGGGRYPLDTSEVREAAGAFTAGPAFPPLFAQANRAAHGWLFSDPATADNGNQWAVDVAPMLRDPSIQPLLSRHNVMVPAKLTVPLTVSVPHSLRQGRLSPLATWGPWVSVGAAALCGVCALLTLAAARRRGKALSSLGVSALLVGAAGWAGIEVAARYLNAALNHTTGNVRVVAEVMAGHAEAGLRQWLNVTLLAGAALVALGVVVAMLGSLAKKS